MKKINFGIIGCGRIAQRHAEIINRVANLSAVCDVKAERAAEFAKKYNCAKYTYYHKMIADEIDIDVVSVCTPNYLHSLHTIDSLKARQACAVREAYGNIGSRVQKDDG